VTWVCEVKRAERRGGAALAEVEGLGYSVEGRGLLEYVRNKAA